MRRTDPNDPYANYATPAPTHKRSKLPWLFAGLAVLFVICGFFTVFAFNQDANDGVEIVTTSTTPPPPVKGGEGQPLARKAPPTKKAPVNQIEEGGYVVGEDVPAGRYRTEGALKSVITLCYWEVRPSGNPNGKIGPQGAVDSETEQADVVLTKGAYFKTTGCQPWTKR